MTIAVWAIVILGVVVGTGYYAFGMYAAWAFNRAHRQRSRSSTATPPVTLLKPLRGLGTELEANLESFCTLDYPAYQILLAVADANDPAVAVADRLRRRHPDRDIAIVVDSRVIGSNRKVSNLVHMMPRAKYDIVVVSDSDIRVPPDYLRQIVQPFANDRVGLVTCLYRGVPSRRRPTTRIEALFVNTDFMPMVLVAQRVERFRYAFGATIAITREALDAIGGFEATADHLADDYQLGHLVTGKGYQAVLSPLIVETHLDADTWRDLARHQLRWARTYRVCRPGGYFATILTHGTSWAVALLLLSRFSTMGWQVLAVTLAVRLLEAVVVGNRYMGSSHTLHDLWAVPFKDLLLTLVWFASFLGNDVDWAGERLVVEPDGRMHPLEPRAETVVGSNGAPAAPEAVKPPAQTQRSEPAQPAFPEPRPHIPAS